MLYANISHCRHLPLSYSPSLFFQHPFFLLCLYNLLFFTHFFIIIINIYFFILMYRFLSYIYWYHCFYVPWTSTITTNFLALAAMKFSFSWASSDLEIKHLICQARFFNILNYFNNFGWNDSLWDLNFYSIAYFNIWNKQVSL